MMRAKIELLIVYIECGYREEREGDITRDSPYLDLYMDKRQIQLKVQLEIPSHKSLILFCVFFSIAFRTYKIMNKSFSWFVKLRKIMTTWQFADWKSVLSTNHLIYILSFPIVKISIAKSSKFWCSSQLEVETDRETEKL